jgi:WD40 repeat protein
MRVRFGKFHRFCRSTCLGVGLVLAVSLTVYSCELSPPPTSAVTPVTSAPPALQISPTSTPTALEQVKKPTPITTGTEPPPVPSTTFTPTLVPENISVSNLRRIEQQAVIDYPPWDLVTSIAWSPNGELLAAAAGDSIHLYAANTLELIGTFHTGALTHGLTFSPDSNLLAAGSHDGMVRIWDLGGGPIAIEPVLKLEAHKKGTNCVAFSPDGRWLASGGNDAVVRVWDVKSGERLQQIIGGSYSIPRIAFTPDGTSLAIANGPLVRLREVESGRIVDTYRVEPLIEGGVWFYPTLYSLAYSPDGRYLVAGDHLNQVHIWDLRSQEKPISPITYARQAESSRASPMTLVWDVTYSPDGTLLLAASGAGVRMWEAASGELQSVLDEQSGVVTSLAFNPSGDILASGGLDAKLRLWTVEP